MAKLFKADECRAYGRTKSEEYLLKKYKPDRPRPERCELCGKKQERKLFLDHCHKTGRFRGWLCCGCNAGLGLLGDSIDGLLKAISYLNNFYKEL